MATLKARRLNPTARAVQQPQAWEMVSGFMLRLADQPGNKTEAVEPLAPIVAALRPYGLEDADLLAISAEVDQVGEELRGCCPEGRLDCVTVRVHLSSAALRAAQHVPPKPIRSWDYFVVKNIASSESDNLEMMEDPRCFIDLHVFEG